MSREEQEAEFAVACWIAFFSGILGGVVGWVARMVVAS